MGVFQKHQQQLMMTRDSCLFDALGRAKKTLIYGTPVVLYAVGWWPAYTSQYCTHWCCNLNGLSPCWYRCTSRTCADASIGTATRAAVIVGSICNGRPWISIFFQVQHSVAAVLWLSSIMYTPGHSDSMFPLIMRKCAAVCVCLCVARRPALCRTMPLQHANKS